jgi:hypothetical protein
MTPGLREAAEAAREHASRCCEPSCHRTALALEAIITAGENRALLDALTEEGPTDDIPPWSQVSKPGTSEGPLPF